jgi:hypothetical protein
MPRCTIQHTTYNIRQRSRAAASDATMRPTSGRRATAVPTVALAPCAVRIRRGFESTRTRPSGQQLRACRTFVRHRLYVCRPKGCMLSVARCILHVVAGCIIACCLLHAVGCMLHAAGGMLPAACCLLSVACCMLSVACCLLHVVCCMLQVVRTVATTSAPIGSRRLLPWTAQLDAMSERNEVECDGMRYRMI